MKKVLGALLLTVVATAQQVEPPKRARIEGRVVSTTGEPVPRATVRLDRRAVEADDEGRFVFDGIEPLTYRLTAERPGYITAIYGARPGLSGGTPLVLLAGQVSNDLVITMSPQAVITGTVTNAAGEPVEGVTVAAMNWRYLSGGGGGRNLMASGVNGKTTERGEYRISGLPAGRHYVMAVDNMGLAESRAKSGAGAPITTFYPGGIVPSDVQPLEVAAGQQLQGIDLRLQTAPVYSVRGRVIDASGAPITGISVQITPSAETVRADMLSVSRSRPDPQVSSAGVFETRGLRPGTYTLFVGPPLNQLGQLPIDVTPPLVATREVTIVNADVEGITLEVRRAARVTGSVTVEDGGQALISTGPSIFFSRGVMGTVPVRTKDDLTFAVDVVTPGMYQVYVTNLRKGYYAKSARMGDRDGLEGPVDLTSGVDGRLSIVISNKAADITGVVKWPGGEPQPGMALTLWSPRGSWGARTDQNGAFQFQSLGPGDYRLAAWEEIDSGLALYASFLNLFASDATALRLEEGSHHALEIQPIPADKIKAAEARLP